MRIGRRLELLDERGELFLPIVDCVLPLLSGGSQLLRLDGTKIATVEIDPLAYGLTVGWRF